MQLVIKDGYVISYFRDEQQASAPEGAEIIQWDGPLPERPQQEVGGIVMYGFASDPRTEAQRLADAKARKLAELMAWDATRRQAGVPFGSYMVRCAEYDQRRFATLLVAINEAIAQEAMSLDSDIDIWDVDGVKHTMTAGAFKSSVPAYLFACQGLEVELGLLADSIDEAQSSEELDAITFE